VRNLERITNITYININTSGIGYVVDCGRVKSKLYDSKTIISE
jgi:HrpA-like RNA helicase